MKNIHRRFAQSFLMSFFVAVALFVPGIGSADVLKFESTDIIVKDVGGGFVNGVWVSSPNDPADYEISYNGTFYVEQITPGYNWVGQSNLAFWGKIVDWDITLTAKGGHGGGYDAIFPPGGWGFEYDQNFNYTKANSFMIDGNSRTDEWIVQVLNAGNFYPGYEFYLFQLPLIYPNGSEAAVASGTSVPGSVLHFGSDIWIQEQGASGHTVILRGPYVNVSEVPEPATVILCGLGLLGLSVVRKRSGKG